MMQNKEKKGLFPLAMGEEGEGGGKISKQM